MTEEPLNVDSNMP